MEDGGWRMEDGGMGDNEWMSATARLTLARTAPNDVGIRQVFVSVDGKDVAVLVHGQTATVDIEPGEHKMRIHNTLVWKTVMFDASAGEAIRYDIINRAGFGTMALVATLGVGPIYLTVLRQ
jgi:hypothetical protein